MTELVGSGRYHRRYGCSMCSGRRGEGGGTGGDRGGGDRGGTGGGGTGGGDRGLLELHLQ